MHQNDMRNVKEISAGLLSIAMTDALAPSDMKAKAQAIMWLGLYRKLRLSELMTPEPLGFIACCREIGADPLEIRRTILAADSIDDHTFDAAPYLLYFTPSHSSGTIESNEICNRKRSR